MNATGVDARPPLSPTAVALGGAAIISFSAILYRLSGADPTTGAFLRMAYAVPLLVVVRWFRRAADERTGRERALAATSGALLGLDVIAWQSAIDHIGAGLATLVANSQVIIVPLVTWLIFRERPGNRVFIAMPVVVVGLAAVTGLGGTQTFGERPALGVLLGVLAAMLYSGFLIGFRRSSRRLAPAAAPLLDATIGAAVAVALAGLVLGELTFSGSWQTHAWLIVLAFGPQTIGWLAIGYALPRLPAAITSFAILLQPSLTLLWGFLIFQEEPSVIQLGGVVLVISGVAMVAAQRGRT